MLPDLGFSVWCIENSEVFFKVDNEVRRVVTQEIPASILVKLPGGLTDVGIGFPIPSLARIYIIDRSIDKGALLTKVYFIGEFGDGKRFYHLPKRVIYRYGVELSPWMYHGYLKTAQRDIKSRIVNYVIENCSVGFSGIQLKLKDEFERDKRGEEWFKLFWFDGGNEYHFFNEEHTKILELLPIKQGSRLFWEPRDEWNQFKRIKNIPVKTQ